MSFYIPEDVGSQEAQNGSLVPASTFETLFL